MNLDRSAPAALRPLAWRALRVAAVLTILAATAVAPAAQAQPAPLAVAQAQNLKIVRTFLETGRAGRPDLLPAQIAADFTLYEADGLPFGGVYHGWEGFVLAGRKLQAFWAGKNQLLSVEYVPYGDDKVIVHLLVEGRIASNGRTVQMPVLEIWEIKGGKIASIRPFFFDTKRIADLAAAPADPPAAK